MKRSLGPKTILYPTPVLVVGTYDASDKPNVMTVAWGGICCSDPPCVAISVREATHTYAGLVSRGEFTINIAPESYVKQVDYFGIASGKNSDKFQVTGLTPVKSDLVNAPYIEEFPMILECKVIHSFKIGLHTQFIGKILDIKVEEAPPETAGQALIEQIHPLLWAPDSRGYYGVGRYVGKAFSIGRELLQGD